MSSQEQPGICLFSTLRQIHLKKEEENSELKIDLCMYFVNLKKREVGNKGRYIALELLKKHTHSEFAFHTLLIQAK